MKASEIHDAEENATLRDNLGDLQTRANGPGTLRKLMTRGKWLISPIFVIGIWCLATYARHVSPLLYPTPSSVVAGGWQVILHGYDGVSFWADIGISLKRLGIGWGLAIVCGVAIGLFTGLSSTGRAIFDPIIEFYRPIPPLGYLSLLIIWFGIGETSKDIVLFLAALPPTVLNTADGVKNVRPDRIQGVLTLGGRRRDVIRYVILPSSLPGIITGTRVSFGNAFSTLVAAETLAASSGLGWLSIQASNYLNTKIVIFAVIVMGIIGFGIDRAIRIIQVRACPWQGHG